MQRKIICIIALTLIIFIAGCAPKSIIGDCPKYANPKSCGEYAKFVIKSNNLELLHSCKEEKLVIDNEEYILVKLTIGPAENCSYNCQYKPLNYLVKTNKSMIKEVS